MTKVSLLGSAATMEQQPCGTAQRSGPSKAQWECHRSQIIRLYRDENLKLKEVMVIMKQEGFVATGRMYKDRMKKWGLAKNIKEHEAIAILRIKSERDAAGKDTLIEKHNHTVEIGRCIRHTRRKGLGEAALSSASVPSYISCRTPPPESLSQAYNGESFEVPTLSSITLHSEKESLLEAEAEAGIYESGVNWLGNSVPVFDGRKARTNRMSDFLEFSTIPQSPPPPPVLGIPEQLFRNISLYYVGSFHCGQWISRTRDGAAVFEVDSFYDPDQRNELQGDFYMAGNLKANGSLNEFRRVLSKAFRLVHGILQRSHPRTLDRLFSSMLWLLHNGLTEVALLLRDYIRSLSIRLTSVQQPWGRIFLLLGNLDEQSLEHVLINAWKCNNDALDRGLGSFSDAGLLTHLNHIHHVYETYDGRRAEKLLWSLYDECERASNKTTTQIPTIMLSLGHSMLAQGKHDQTEDMALGILLRAQTEPRISFNLRVDAMVLAARAQYQQRRGRLAEKSMLDAIHMLTEEHGEGCPLATRYVNLLESWLREWGRTEDADELKKVADVVIGLDETDVEQNGQL
ncbi:hypothetical protein DL98DRAFT_647299 [Cadophora sp. DSE1049]|nr:hypothetical protein DL98DRAFT_647299 [Cadophora sp. DSE1049]